MRSVCGAGRRGGRRSGFHAISYPRSQHARKDTAARVCHLMLLWGRMREGNSTTAYRGRRRSLASKNLDAECRKEQSEFALSRTERG